MCFESLPNKALKGKDIGPQASFRGERALGLVAKALTLAPSGSESLLERRPEGHLALYLDTCSL